MAKVRRSRRAAHKANKTSTSRRAAAKRPDKHVGHKVHTHTVNAPKAW